jgi:hypothetical protein
VMRPALRAGMSLDQRLAEVRAEAAALKATGRWVSGSADLLSVIGQGRQELVHTRILAWLVDPIGRHGMGDLFLRRLLATLWPDDEFDVQHVRVSREQSSIGVAEGEDELLSARADLVIRLPSDTIVIENKVDAAEQPRQCERLFRAFQREPARIHYVFLSPSGRHPATVETDLARLAWTPLSYLSLRDVLKATIDAMGPPIAELGRQSVEQYIGTLERRFRMANSGQDVELLSDERLRFYLRNRDDIREWARLKDGVLGETQRLLGGTTPVLEQLLLAVAPDVVVGRADRDKGRGEWPSFSRVLARRSTWPERIGITLEWPAEADPFSGRGLKYGVFAGINHPEVAAVSRDVATRIASSKAMLVPGTKQEPYWPLARLVPRSRTWWERPIEWRLGLCELLVGVWTEIAPMLDDAVRFDSYESGLTKEP